MILSSSYSQEVYDFMICMTASEIMTRLECMYFHVILSKPLIRTSAGQMVAQANALRLRAVSHVRRLNMRTKQKMDTGLAQQVAEDLEYWKGLRMQGWLLDG